jgi:hypothetical protein
MRLRVLVLISLTLVAFAVPTAPVAAKGPTSLVVSGDGIDGAIVLRAIHRPARWWKLVDAARFFEFDGGSQTAALTSAGGDAQETDLGTRIRLTWIVPGGGDDGETGCLTQELYPFAPGGARLYTPDGQRVYRYAVAAGWHRADPDVVALLRRLGVPVVRGAAVTADIGTTRPTVAPVWGLLHW